MNQDNKNIFSITLIISIVVSSLIGGSVGFWGANLYLSVSPTSIWIKENILGMNNVQTETKIIGDKKITKINEESDIVSVIDNISPAVVSIIVTKDLPKIEQYSPNTFPNNDFFDQLFGNNLFNFNIPQYRQNGTEKKEIGGGTGFIVSSDGYIVTNKHVVSDEDAEYSVLMNNEKKYDAQVIARDRITDLAVLKIEGENLTTVELGDSTSLKVGQTVIAIGNALGEFRNTVSVGVISGLSRSITAGGMGQNSEQLSGVIQTDASINPGNSGGPLLNIAGQVIGINTAIVQGAQNIGFAIPIEDVKNSIKSVQDNGKIIQAWLGVRYVLIDETIADSNKLDYDYGALILRGKQSTDLAVIPGSPADKSGLTENDIILEVEGKKINKDFTLAKAISQYQPNDKVTLKVFQKGTEKDINVTLAEQ